MVEERWSSVTLKLKVLGGNVVASIFATTASVNTPYALTIIPAPLIPEGPCRPVGPKLPMPAGGPVGPVEQMNAVQPDGTAWIPTLLALVPPVQGAGLRFEGRNNRTVMAKSSPRHKIMPLIAIIHKLRSIDLTPTALQDMVYDVAYPVHTFSRTKTQLKCDFYIAERI